MYVVSMGSTMFKTDATYEANDVGMVEVTKQLQLLDVHYIQQIVRSQHGYIKTAATYSGSTVP